MMYAIDEGGERIRPERKLSAFCPGCRKPVIAKCGELKVHHWAHVSGCECDPWHEPETNWHVHWKLQFEERCREVLIAPHRADIRATWKESDPPADCVIELQHSPIEPAEIDEREIFYHMYCTSMMWIIDVRDVREHFILRERARLNGGATIRATFKWKWFRFSWTASHFTGRLFDFGDGLWHVEEISDKGSGVMRSCTYHEFLSSFEESVGHNLPVHWRRTSTGGWIYRFGRGNVVMFHKDGWFKFLTIFDGSEPKFSKHRYRTAEEAKRQCEPHLTTLMKQ